MLNWAALIAPIAFVLPLVSAGGSEAERSLAPPVPADAEVGEAQPWVAFQPWQNQPDPMQVRIQQRVVVRVSPARPRNSLVADLPRQLSTRMVERKMGKCVALRDVLAVQTGGPSKLILYLRDRQMISAQLEKACSARDFYSGFYVEPSRDGNLCVSRDELQSRSGAKCELSALHRLEAVRD